MAGIGSMMKGPIAAMRHRIDIEEATKTIDSSRQQIKTYEAKLMQQPASFQQVSGGEYVRGRQIEAGVTAIFRVNYREDYSVEDRIAFNGLYYGIVLIDVPHGIKRFADIYCKAAPAP